MSAADAFHRERRRRELGELAALAWPVILSRLGIMTMGLTDAVVVGHYSAQELGYQSLGWAPVGVILTTGVGLLAGVQIMTARHIGEDRREATGGVFRRGMVYGAWIGLIVAVLAFAYGPALMGWLGVILGLDSALAQGGGAVMRVLALMIPLHMVGTAATYYLEALSRPKPAALAMWVCNVINLALVIPLVFGLGPIPALGAVGAAWGTVLARAVLAAWLVIYIVRMPDARSLGVFDPPVDGPECAIEQRRVGYGGGASYFVEAAAFSSMAFLAGALGALGVAAWAIVLNVTAVIFMAPLGLSAATAVLVGRAYGAGDRPALMRAGNLGFAVTVALLTLVSLFVVAFPRLIAGAYATDPALVNLAAGALLLASLFFIFDGLQAVAAQALRARGDVLVSTIIHVVSYAVVMMPLAWFLAIPMGLGLNGIVWAVIVASVMAAALQTGRFWLLGTRPDGSSEISARSSESR